MHSLASPQPPPISVWQTSSQNQVEATMKQSLFISWIVLRQTWVFSGLWAATGPLVVPIWHAVGGWWWGQWQWWSKRSMSLHNSPSFSYGFLEKLIAHPFYDSVIPFIELELGQLNGTEPLLLDALPDCLCRVHRIFYFCPDRETFVAD